MPEEKFHQREWRLFHCTPAENLPKILKEGLLPPCSLSIDYTLVGFIGDIAECEEVAVLEVDWDWERPYYLDPDGPGHLQTRGWTIPPSAIKHLRTERRPESGQW
jgi:hypothetical protein